MTIEKLIEKMRKELPKINGEPNGTYCVLSSKITDIEKTKERYESGKISFLAGTTICSESYYFVSGMLWAYFSTGFITEEERVILINEISGMTSVLP